MAFELFERRLGRLSSTPTVGLQKKGTLSLNASAFALLMSTQQSSKNSSKHTKSDKNDGKVYVEFFYDRARQIVGMRVSSADSRNSYPIRKQPQSESYVVAGKAFFTHHEIPTDEVRRFTPRVYDGNILGFSLAEG